MTEPYLPESPEEPDTRKISVVLENEEALDLHRVAAVWRAHSPKKNWSGASLARRAIALFLKGAWATMGGKPERPPAVDFVSRKKTVVHWSQADLRRLLEAIREREAKTPHCPHCNAVVRQEELVLK